jgi:phosphatidyl-myo-inositol alpha-mannosyltransferase
MSGMKVALVSPYSWSYPGGVTRHIDALAQQFIADGHEVRVLAPHDPPDFSSKTLHRGVRPVDAPLPDYVIPIGRTVGFKANGAVSNLSITPQGVAKVQRELRTGGYDVVHIHEPVAPLTSWFASDFTPLPLIGTFHSFSENRFSNGIANMFGARLVLNHLHVRIAVSQAAAWTGRRFFGGHYRVIPNGVHLDDAALAAAGRPIGDKLRIVFVGAAVERKGLPLLLRAFEALHEQVPSELTVIGPSREQLEPLMMDASGVRLLEHVDDDQKRLELQAADVLCAPSLRGESFGMVLTEAFAAGTPVIASDIAGYRDVVRNGVDGILVPPADPQALAESLRDLWDEPERRVEMSRAAAANVRRFAWPTVATDVMRAYQDAIEVPKPVGSTARVAVAVGITAADMRPHAPARRLPSLEPKPVGKRRPLVTAARRIGFAVVMLGLFFLVWKALTKIGIANIVSALATSSPSFVILGLGIMCAAMVMRGFSWLAILRAALPKTAVRVSDAMQATFIGVLMNSTLPARLGEPSRAVVLARRTGRPRENIPIVLGTVVSQTLLNIVALIVLGAVMFSSVDLFSGRQNTLLIAAIAPAALLALVLLAPLVLRGAAGSRSHRVQVAMQSARAAMVRVRAGLVVFRDPKLGPLAALAQLSAWALQWLSCYVLLVALGLSHQAGLAAAAAVLFAVNITAALPATPANLGVFQAACAAVLHAGWHVGIPTGVAYGVILQAVEVATAILMGAPALLKEGMSWREVRLRAMNATPVKLPARPQRAARSSRRSGAEANV